MDQAVRNIVRDRAGDRCEYCGLGQNQSPLASLHVEHVIPKKHGGTDDLNNLALACVDCNLRKGPNLTGYDPQTRSLTELFNPRRQAWSDHFEYRGVFVVGKTAVGRTTIEVLRLNDDDRLDLRIVTPGQ